MCVIWYIQITSSQADSHSQSAIQKLWKPISCLWADLILFDIDKKMNCSRGQDLHNVLQ